MMREYQIDLVASLSRLTWRKFLVLIRGLSTQSATVTQISQARYRRRKKDDVVEIMTPEAADKAFVALFGHAKTRPN